MADCTLFRMPPSLISKHPSVNLQLTGPMPIMIWLAIIIEFAIQNWLDGGILLFIQFANATLGWYESVKAADAVAALKASLKPQATVKRDGRWQNLDARGVVPGDLVLLSAGAAVPADCIVNEGRLEVDQSALTGESMPVTMTAGDCPKMGSTVTRGEVEATVDATGKHTFFGKTATLLQGDEGSLGSLQRLLLKIMFVLISISLTLCTIALIYLCTARHQSFKHALSFTIVLLVASIPIAIEIVCATTLALGSRQMSKQGAIVARLQAIEEMAGINMLCSDKTGTLTLNQMMIQDHCPTYSPFAADMKGTVQYAALAAKWGEPAKDALDKMVLGAADLDALQAYTLLTHLPFDPTTKRTESTVRENATGQVFKVTKGAPQVVAVLLEDAGVKEQVASEVQVLAARGVRALAVARTTDAATEAWVMVGILTFLDPPRPDTKETIESALEHGVDVKMITGDQVLIAREMARLLGLGTNIPDASGLPKLDKDGKIPDDLGRKYGEMIIQADGFAQVFPEHKYLIVAALQQAGFCCAMTGDGVNDAPALKKADVGIAVSGATDAARAAADIVFTEPGLSTVIHAIIIARCIFQRVRNFITYRVAATLQLLCFFFIAVFAFPPVNYYCKVGGPNEALRDTPYCPDFFQLPVLLMMLITLLNDGTLISVGYDRAVASPRPEKWNLRVLFTISSVLGAVSMGSSLLLLWAALDSPNQGSLFQKIGLPVPDYGQITMLIYLKVSLSDFLTLFSARSNPGPFFAHRPGNLLVGAAGVALGLSTLLACLWPQGQVDEIAVEGLTRGEYTLWPLWIWIYCFVFWLVQDALKVGAYWILLKFDIFQARTAALVNVRDATAPKDVPLGRHATGMVEKKLLRHKLDAALAAIERVVTRRLGGRMPPELHDVSVVSLLGRRMAHEVPFAFRVRSLFLRRLFVRLIYVKLFPILPLQRLSQARNSISSTGQPSAAPLPASALADIQTAAEQAAHHMPEEDHRHIERHLSEVNRVATRLQRVSAVLQPDPSTHKTK